MHEPGEILQEKYRLDELIGEGGMGEVFRATHLQLNKHIAIKFLRSEEARDEITLARFNREAQAAAAIGHPSIIDIYDTGVTEKNAPYLVMEYLVGQSLKQELEQRLRLGVAEVSYIICQVLSALDAAHSKGIIHRDLKPDNIFLTDVGRETPEIKLLDFGISKILDKALEDNTITTTGTILGTPFYMSPEQARGMRELDHRVDIYAIGVILYECITGVLPIVGDNYNELIVNIITQRVKRPSEKIKGIPLDFEAVILKSLEKTREDRFSSAQEMLDALIPFVEKKLSGHISRSAKSRSKNKSQRPPTESEKHYAALSTVNAQSEWAEEQQPPEGPSPEFPKKTRRSSSKNDTNESEDHPQGEQEDDFLPEDTQPDDSLERKQGGSRRIFMIFSLILISLILGVSLTASYFLSTQNDTQGSGREIQGIQTDQNAEDAQNTQDVKNTQNVQNAQKQKNQKIPVEPKQSRVQRSYIEIQIEATPEDAEVYVDDAAIPELPFKGRFPRDGLLHTIRVEAKGYKSWARLVPFDRDHELKISLTQTKHEKVKIRRIKRPPIKGTKKPPPDSDPWRGLPAPSSQSGQ